MTFSDIFFPSKLIWLRPENFPAVLICMEFLKKFLLGTKVDEVDESLSSHLKPFTQACALMDFGTYGLMMNRIVSTNPKLAIVLYYFCWYQVKDNPRLLLCIHIYLTNLFFLLSQGQLCCVLPLGSLTRLTAWGCHSMWVVMAEMGWRELN